MSIRISIVKAMPYVHWGESHFAMGEPVDWRLDLAYLLYLWEGGEDTILETAFYELFDQGMKFHPRTTAALGKVSAVAMETV